MGKSEELSDHTIGHGKLGWQLEIEQSSAFADIVASHDGVAALARLFEAATNKDFDTAKKYIYRFRKPGSFMTIQMRDDFAKAIGKTPSQLGTLLKLPTLDARKALPQPVEEPKSIKKEHSNELKEFSAFFGPAVLDCRRPVQLVFPKRIFTEKAEDSDEPPLALEKQCKFYLGGKICKNVWPEAVSGFLAFDDVLAVNHLSNVIVQMTGRAPWLRQENYSAIAQGLGECVISFGLGYSAATHLAQHHFHPPLFKVYCGPSPKQFRHPLTDLFTLKYEAGSTDGESADASQREIPIPDDIDITLILRIVPEPNKFQNPQPWFICAGRTAPGTEVAGYYLAYHWKKLAELYKQHDKSLKMDSLAAVIRHDEPALLNHDVRRDAGLSIAEEAKLHFWDEGEKQPCIAFGRWI